MHSYQSAVLSIVGRRYVKATYGLTRREMELLMLLCSGVTDRAELAERMQIRPPTVRSHLDNVFGKLQVNSVPALIFFVLHDDVLRALCFPQIKVWSDE
jgi:DNA-binding CsgD family transcriptional regulator